MTCYENVCGIAHTCSGLGKLADRNCSHILAKWKEPLDFILDATSLTFLEGKKHGAAFCMYICTWTAVDGDLLQLFDYLAIWYAAGIFCPSPQKDDVLGCGHGGLSSSILCIILFFASRCGRRPAYLFPASLQASLDSWRRPSSHNPTHPIHTCVVDDAPDVIKKTRRFA